MYGIIESFRPRQHHTTILSRRRPQRSTSSLVEHLADRLEAGTGPLPGAARARHVLEIMLAAQTAAATGQTIP